MVKERGPRFFGGLQGTSYPSLETPIESSFPISKERVKIFLREGVQGLLGTTKDLVPTKDLGLSPFPLPKFIYRNLYSLINIPVIFKLFILLEATKFYAPKSVQIESISTWSGPSSETKLHVHRLTIS